VIFTNKIVLTGGPCGGKSSILESIENKYDKKGCHLYPINETVKLLFTSGFNSIKINGQNLPKIDFQTMIFITQYLKEYSAELQTNRDDKSIIICDRGLLDGKVYTSSEEYDIILQKLNKCEALILKTYGIVLHLTSMCCKDIDFFNQQRPYAMENGLSLEHDLRKIWQGNPNHHIIPATDKIEEKMNIVFQYLDNMQHENSPMLRDYYSESDFLNMKDYLRGLFDNYENNTNSEDKAKVLKLHDWYRERNII
jgi:predicted ATPase